MSKELGETADDDTQCCVTLDVPCSIGQRDTRTVVFATDAEQSTQNVVLIVETNIDGAMNRSLEVIVLPETSGNAAMDEFHRQVACIEALTGQRVDVR